VSEGENVSGYVFDCEVLVVEAGSGVVLLRGTHSKHGGEVSSWLLGRDIGTVLDQVMASVLAGTEGPDLLDIGGFGLISKQESRRLLPRLLRAAIAAAASTDKNEAMMLRGPGDPPADPFCHACGYPTSTTVRDSDWPGRCDQRGHQAFGAKEDEVWEESLERHRRDVRRWQFHLDIGLISPRTVSTP
jgi:hypothetical protein